MAHVQPNPGYGDYESTVKKANNLPNLLTSEHYREDTSKTAHGDPELCEIKAWAKKTWSRPDLKETTYQFQYGDPKSLIERTKSAPTESERKNKPHPKQ